jgi:hypothetical protein
MEVQAHLDATNEALALRYAPIPINHKAEKAEFVLKTYMSLIL